MLLLYIRPQVVDPTSMSDARFSLKKKCLISRIPNSPWRSDIIISFIFSLIPNGYDLTHMILYMR